MEVTGRVKKSQFTRQILIHNYKYKWRPLNCVLSQIGFILHTFVYKQNKARKNISFMMRVDKTATKNLQNKQTTTNFHPHRYGNCLPKASSQFQYLILTARHLQQIASGEKIDWPPTLSYYCALNLLFALSTREVYTIIAAKTSFAEIFIAWAEWKIHLVQNLILFLWSTTAPNFPAVGITSFQGAKKYLLLRV